MGIMTHIHNRRQWLIKRQHAKSAPRLLIHDEFTDTNGILLPDHTIAPLNTPGNPWVNVNLTNQIQSNQASFSSSGPTYTVVDTGVANARITLVHTRTGGALANCSGIVFRTDVYTSGRLWKAGLNHSTGYLQIMEYNTARAEAVYITTNAYVYFLDCTVNGQTVTLRATRISPSGGSDVTIEYKSASANQSCTKHGLSGKATNNTADDFKVYTV